LGRPAHGRCGDGDRGQPTGDCSIADLSEPVYIVSLHEAPPSALSSGRNRPSSRHHFIAPNGRGPRYEVNCIAVCAAAKTMESASIDVERRTVITVERTGPLPYSPVRRWAQAYISLDEVWHGRPRQALLEFERMYGECRSFCGHALSLPSRSDSGLAKEATSGRPRAQNLIMAIVARQIIVARLGRIARGGCIHSMPTDSIGVPSVAALQFHLPAAARP
jgi:hypothetical protein